MLKNLILCVVIFLCHQGFSQIGINTITPDLSAELDISSTDKGLLIPRVTSVQRLDINLPAEGLTVYDTTTGTFWYFDGVEWVNIGNVDDSIFVRDSDSNVIYIPNLSDGTTARPVESEFVIEDSGNVGIGKADPDWKLEVVSSGLENQWKNIVLSGNPQSGINMVSSDPNSTNAWHIMNEGNVDRVSIRESDIDGNVPVFAAESGAGLNGGLIYFNSLGNIALGKVNDNSLTNKTTGVKLELYSSGNDETTKAISVLDSDETEISYLKDNGEGYYAGNVGIGVVDPEWKFEVSATGLLNRYRNIVLSGNTQPGINMVSSSPNSTNAWHIMNEGNVDRVSIRESDIDGNVPVFAAESGAGLNGGLIYFNSLGNIALGKVNDNSLTNKTTGVKLELYSSGNDDTTKAISVLDSDETEISYLKDNGEGYYAGNVGIGVVDPQWKLEVSSSGVGNEWRNIVLSGNGQPGMNMVSSSPNSTSAWHIMNEGNVDRVSIRESNIDITDDPVFAAEGGAASNGGIVYINSLGNVAIGKINDNVLTNKTTGVKLELYSSGNDDTTKAISVLDSDETEISYLKDNGDGYYAGNVGIGVSDTDFKLEVSATDITDSWKNLVLSGNNQSGMNIVSSSPNSSNAWHIMNEGNVDRFSIRESAIGVSSNRPVFAAENGAGVNDGTIYINALGNIAIGKINNNSLTNKTSGVKVELYSSGNDETTKAMSILDSDETEISFIKDNGDSYYSGNVGIGVTDPDSKLEVNGTIKATDINFTGLSTFADDAAAAAGGLNSGDMYKTADGNLRIKL